MSEDANSRPPRVRRRIADQLLSLGLTGARVLSAIAVNKIMAIYLGPSGLALVGQFQNFTAVAFGVTSGNITNAVISTVAANHGNEERRRAVGTSVAAALLGTFVVSTGIAVCAAPLATWVLGESSLAYVMVVLAVAMLPAITHVVLLAVLLGMGASATFAAIQVALAAASVPACWILVTRYGISGALLSAVLVNSCMLLTTVLWISGRRLFPLSWLFSGIHSAQFSRLARLAGMSLSTIIAIPVAQLIVRQQIIAASGGDAAGHWQAALKMGELLLMLASATVAIQFLPRFSLSGKDASRLVPAAAWTVLALLSPVAILTTIGSHWIVPALFSAEFSEAVALLPVQFSGDILRGVTMVVQAAFMAQSRSRSYIAVDVAYAMSLVIVASAVVPTLGAGGASWAVLAASTIALLLALTLNRSPHRGLQV